jgi:hypothetical protein
MDDTGATTHETDALLSRLLVIEDAHVHEQLQAQLEGGDTHHR